MHLLWEDETHNNDWFWLLIAGHNPWEPISIICILFVVSSTSITFTPHVNYLQQICHVESIWKDTYVIHQDILTWLLSRTSRRFTSFIINLYSFRIILNVELSYIFSGFSLISSKFSSGPWFPVVPHFTYGRKSEAPGTALFICFSLTFFIAPSRTGGWNFLVLPHLYADMSTDFFLHAKRQRISLACSLWGNCC